MIVYKDEVLKIEYDEDNKKWHILLSSLGWQGRYINPADRSIAVFNALAEIRNRFDSAIIAVIDNMAKERAKL